MIARSSFISEWLEVRAGEIHLARRTPEGLASQSRWLVPEGTKSALVVIVADPARQSYRNKVIDPATEGFARGSCLLMNLSKINALVVLASARVYLFFIPDPARQTITYLSYREYAPFE